MVGLLLGLFAAAVLFPRPFGALLKVGTAVLLMFAVWLAFHPGCESAACFEALQRYQENLR